MWKVGQEILGFAGPQKVKFTPSHVPKPDPFLVKGRGRERQRQGRVGTPEPILLASLAHRPPDSAIYLPSNDPPIKIPLAPAVGAKFVSGSGPVLSGLLLPHVEPGLPAVTEIQSTQERMLNIFCCWCSFFLFSPQKDFFYSKLPELELNPDPAKILNPDLEDP